MSESRVRVERHAARDVPHLIMPDGSKVVLGVGQIAGDPHKVAREIDEWHCAWISEWNRAMSENDEHAREDADEEAVDLTWEECENIRHETVGDPTVRDANKKLAERIREIEL